MEDYLKAKKYKSFVSPNGEKYEFDYEKTGRKYIYILIYNGHKMQIKPKDFNNTPIDDLIDLMKKVFIPQI